jgi:hypothetical protein
MALGIAQPSTVVDAAALAAGVRKQVARRHIRLGENVRVACKACNDGFSVMTAGTLR